MKKSILILSLVVLGFTACTSNVPAESTTDSTTVVDSTTVDSVVVDSTVVDSTLNLPVE